MCSTILVALSVLSAGAEIESYADSNNARQTWRVTVSQALREQATAVADRQVAALTKLVRISEELDAAAELSTKERNRLERKIQRRLDRVVGDISRDMQRRQANVERIGRPAEAIANDRAILAQWGNVLRQFGGGAVGQPRKSGAEGLVELIQRTIEPDSWDINGGPGTIAIFGQ